MNVLTLCFVLPLCIGSPSGAVPSDVNEQPVSPITARGHEWLQQLVGEWTYEAEGILDPSQPPVKSHGTESTRALGELWVVAEISGEEPGGVKTESLQTLGYDPEAKKYVGTFVSSGMSHLWVFDGTLDDSGRVLTMVAEGPSFAVPGGKAKYRDVIEMKSADHRVHTSSILLEEGKWFDFATVHYRRKAK